MTRFTCDIKYIYIFSILYNCRVVDGDITIFPKQVFYSLRLHKLKIHDKAAGERALHVLIIPQPKRWHPCTGHSLVTQRSFFCCANQEPTLQFHLLRWSLVAPLKWHLCISRLSVKQQQSSEIPWSWTSTKYSVLLSCSSPCMGEDTEIVA